ncbi:MAG: hypothetical protein O2958_15145 [Gemmatimonadetes bacterium]|nr:hypothetical protein [Gemmatimonadota bacterium]
MFALRRRSSAHALLALTLSLAVTACGDDMGPEEEEPEVATMRITVGAQSIDVADDGTVTGGPISLSVGSTSISVQFLLANGQPEPLVTDAVFQVNVESDNAGVVSFTRVGAFDGTLVAGAAGSTTVRLALFHIEEAHEDFGPFPVPVVVVP